ncbi:TetR/AcrR family transcriptional regulator [Inquilinus sp. KBS0705]|nr:TetR/AcrR family transcriptional regulator [Inquilinus sp. KBS0705]
MTKAERTRQFIIEQAAPLFNTKGVAGTAMSDIMEATKMAKGGLYGHFESKEELSYAVVDYSLNLLADKLTLALSKAATQKDKLFAFVDFWSKPNQCHLQGGCPMMNFGMEADDTNPVIRQKIKANIEGSIELIKCIISTGIANGEFKADWDAKEFAIRVFAMMEGGTMISRVIGNDDFMAIITKSLKREIENQVV